MVFYVNSVTICWIHDERESDLSEAKLKWLEQHVQLDPVGSHTPTSIHCHLLITDSYGVNYFTSSYTSIYVSETIS